MSVDTENVEDKKEQLIVRLESELARLNVESARKDAVIARCIQALQRQTEETVRFAQEIKSRDTAIAALQNSKSWRLTRPLRMLTERFARGQRVTDKTPEDASPRQADAIAEKTSASAAPVRIPEAIPFDEQGIPIYPSMDAVQKLSLEPYSSEYQDDIDFSDRQSPVKPIAFYLPQFHAIPENNIWWGDGFTEWVNTRKARPLYPGHYEPREPHDDFGYYDLNDVEVIKKQAALAKRHGIYGFCLYYYWFSGKKLLEKPLETILAHPEIDINFCLCWANENWTRRWDGQDDDVLIAQQYAPEDPDRFIDDIQDALRDPRYIRVDGVPVILVYNPLRVENLNSVINMWRGRARELEIGEIQVWMCQTFSTHVDCLEGGICFDGEVEFPPHSLRLTEGCLFVNTDDARSTLYPYTKMVELKIQDIQQGNPRAQIFDIPCYRAITMGWDNTPRRGNGWYSIFGFSLDLFARWVRAVVANAQRHEQEFIFINAWNEWGEGTYLEPDKTYGYATINTFSKALFDEEIGAGE
jgi:hypothetical protein